MRAHAKIAPIIKDLDKVVFTSTMLAEASDETSKSTLWTRIRAFFRKYGVTVTSIARFLDGETSEESLI